MITREDTMALMTEAEATVEMGAPWICLPTLALTSIRSLITPTETVFTQPIPIRRTIVLTSRPNSTRPS